MRTGNRPPTPPPPLEPGTPGFRLARPRPRAVPPDRWRRDSHPQVTGRQRLDGRHPRVVPVLFQTLPHLQQVTETIGGDDPHPCPFPFYQRVGGDGLPVDHQVRISQQLIQGQSVRGCGFLQTDHHAYRRVVRGGLRLEETRLPPFASYDEVGKGASNVYPVLYT